MTSLIQKTLSSALKTFSRVSSQKLTLEDLSPLASLLGRIRAKDINFDENLVSDSYTGEDADNIAPCTYIDIMEEKDVSVGVFVLRKNSCIPLHNHPGMYGLIKVIHGKVSVTSYSIPPNDMNVNSPKLGINMPRHRIRPVIPRGQTYVSASDGCSILTPEEGNIHEICPVDGAAAFLDILAPPYDHETGARVCQYYTKIERDNTKEKDQLEWLAMSGQPADFWCDVAPYRGPELQPT